MIKNLYVVFDKAMNNFSLPMVANDDVEAIRLFYVQLETVPTMNLMPFDFELRMIGKYDDDIGLIDNNEDNILVITGTDALDVFRNKKGDLNEI